MTLDYQIHLPEYLAKCINQGRPQLHCNGHCVLMSKIADKEKEEAEKNLVMYEYSYLYVHKENNIYKISKPDIESDNSPFSPYLTNYHFNYDIAIFRPPIA